MKWIGYAVVLFAISAGPTSRPYWRMKEGAPQGIADWLAKQPTLRFDRAEELKRPIAAAQTRIDRLTPVIQRLEKGENIDRQGTRVSKRRSTNEQLQLIAELKKEVRGIKEDIAGIEKQRQDLLTGYSTLIVAPLELKTGAYGYAGPFKINQRLGDNDALVRYQNRDIWITKFDVREAADDQTIRPAFNLLITGTKTFTSTGGGARTVLYAEPCNHLDWLEKAE